MRLLLVSYDIPQTKEMSLCQLLKGAKGWWHYLRSTWIIATEQNLADWQASIKDSLGSGSFIITDISKNFINGWLPKEAWDWINIRQDLISKNSNGEGVGPENSNK